MLITELALMVFKTFGFGDLVEWSSLVRASLPLLRVFLLDNSKPRK